MQQQKDMVPAVTDPSAEHRLAPVIAGQDLASAVIQDTVKYLGIQATRISNLNGPYLQVRPAGESATDILLVSSWRAHFPPGGDASGAVLDNLLPALPKTSPTAILWQASGSDGMQSLEGTPSASAVPYPRLLATPGGAAASAAGSGDHEFGKLQSPRVRGVGTEPPALQSGGGSPNLMSLDYNPLDHPAPVGAVTELQGVLSKQQGPIIEECHSDSDAPNFGACTRNQHQHPRKHEHRHHRCRSHQSQQERAASAEQTNSPVVAAVDPDCIMEEVPVPERIHPQAGCGQLILDADREPGADKAGLPHGALGQNQRDVQLEGPGLDMAGALALTAAVHSGPAGVINSTAVVPVVNPLVVSPRSRSEWELDPAKISIGRRLAVGGFGEVFLAKYEGTLVAVKRLLATDSDTTQRFVDEVHMLARLRHPNLLLFMGYTLTPEPSIVTEFMARGSLFHILRQTGNRPPDPRMQRAVAVAVARGMAYLHSRMPPILHLDLKSPNVLVDDRWRVKIADFGLSRVRQRTYVSSGAAAGSPEWMAPEVLRCDHYAEAADVYSYGVILWELLTGQPPWADLNAMQVVGVVGYAKRSLPDPPEGDAVLLQLCKTCRAYEPMQRPTFAQVVELLESHLNPSLALPRNGAISGGEATVVPAALQPVAAETRNMRLAALPAPEQLAAPPSERAPPPVPAAAGGTAMDVRGVVGASAPLAVTATSAATRITRRHSLAASPDAADFLDSAVPTGVAGDGGGNNGSCSIGGGSTRLDAQFISVHESPRSRRRYRSPRGEDMMGPPAITARLQDGRKTPSPRTSGGWSWQVLSEGTGATSDGKPAAPMQEQQMVATGVRLMHASASPFAAIAATDFGPDSARSLRKLRADVARTGPMGNNCGGTGSATQEIAGDVMPSAEPHPMDSVSPSALTMPETLPAAGVPCPLPAGPDQPQPSSVLLPQPAMSADAEWAGRSEVATAVLQHSSQPGLELCGQPLANSQHGYPQDFPQHKHQEVLSLQYNRHQPLWQAEQQLHQQTEQQQTQRSILEQNNQTAQQLREERRSQPDQAIGNTFLTRQTLSSREDRRPGHRRVSSDEASRMHHLNTTLHASTAASVPGTLTTVAGVMPLHNQHSHPQQRLLGTVGNTGLASTAGVAGAGAAGSGSMPPLPGRRSRGLARNSAPMRYTYGGASSVAAGAQQLHPLQSPPRPRSFHGQNPVANVHQHVLTANAETAIGPAGYGRHQPSHLGSLSLSTPGGCSTLTFGAVAVSAPMSLSPMSEGGVSSFEGAGHRPSFAAGEIRDKDVAAAGSGSCGGGIVADPWPDTHSELSFAFILRDNVSICSDDYMQSASLDRLPLLEENEMTDPAGEDSDGVVEGDPTSLAQPEADAEIMERLNAGRFESAGANTDSDFELPCPFLKASQPTNPRDCGAMTLSPFALECTQWATTVNNQDNAPTSEADLWGALQTRNSSGNGLGPADYHDDSQANCGPSSPRSDRVNSGGASLCDNGGDVPAKCGMQSHGALSHPQRLGEDKRGSGSQVQLQSKQSCDLGAEKPQPRQNNGGGPTTYRSGRFKVTIEPACSEPQPLHHTSLLQANHHLRQPAEGQSLQHFLSLPQGPCSAAVAPADPGCKMCTSPGRTVAAAPIAGGASGMTVESSNITLAPQSLLQSGSSREVSLGRRAITSEMPDSLSPLWLQQQTGLTLRIDNDSGTRGAHGNGSNDDCGASPQGCAASTIMSPLGESPCGVNGRLRNGHHGHNVHTHHLHGELAAGPPVALNSVTMYRKGRFFVSHAAAGTHSLSVINPNAAPATAQHHNVGCGGNNACNGTGISVGCPVTEAVAEESEDHDGASVPTSPFACAAVTAAAFGRPGSQSCMEGSASQLQGLAAKHTLPVLASLVTASDMMRTNSISRQYSRGRFTVAESIVAAPIAEPRRPLSCSAGGEPPTTAADTVWAPKPPCLAAAATSLGAASSSLAVAPIVGSLDDLDRKGGNFVKPEASLLTLLIPMRTSPLHVTQLQNAPSGEGTAKCQLLGSASQPATGAIDIGGMGGSSGNGGGCSAPSTAPTSPRTENVVVRRVGRFTVREVEGGSNASSRCPSSSGIVADTALRGDLNPNASGQIAAGADISPVGKNGGGGGAAVHVQGHGSPPNEMTVLSSHHSSSSFGSASECSRTSSESRGLNDDLPQLAQGSQQLGGGGAAMPQQQPEEGAEPDARPTVHSALKVLRVKSRGRFTVIDYEAGPPPPPLFPPLEQQQQQEEQQHVSEDRAEDLAPHPVARPQDVLEFTNSRPVAGRDSSSLQSQAAPADSFWSKDVVGEPVLRRSVGGQSTEGGETPHGGVLHPPLGIPLTDRCQWDRASDEVENSVVAVVSAPQVQRPWGMSHLQASEQRAQLLADMERMVRERMERNALEHQRRKEPAQQVHHRLGQQPVDQVGAPLQRGRQGAGAEGNGLGDRCTYEVSFGDGLTIQISHDLEGGGDMAEEGAEDESENDDAVMVDVGIVHGDADDGDGSASDDPAEGEQGEDEADGDSDNGLQPLQPPDTPAHEPVHERERATWGSVGECPDGRRRQRRRRHRQGPGGCVTGDSSDYEDSMEL
ncbi:hypothetical protein Vretimale_1762 [Volvox reticuliferus]|uniref:Protein kinase domain-containing protein n=1 Tax=Volvox reticuliferus TaxID=1737510 RepID=A0A8J4D548_9CHLO|nr:hypothetical protein Vretifemale_15388 [Volvox reticuliferus]GIL95815.1 hypothetical protein Vretimale_1762 [Volvox reticuliferus]